jgi:hypothetical protein
VTLCTYYTYISIIYVIYEFHNIPVLQEQINPNITALGKQALDSNIDIKLLVILKDEENASSVDACRGERIIWTLDHSFEYIEIEKSSPAKGGASIYSYIICILEHTAFVRYSTLSCASPPLHYSLLEDGAYLSLCTCN